MLAGADFGLTKASFLQVIDLLGVPATWTKADGSLSADVVVGFKTAGKEDVAAVNAFGWGVVIMTGAVRDFPQAPEQFDRIEIKGLFYTINAAHPVHLNGEQIGYKILAKGAT